MRKLREWMVGASLLCVWGCGGSPEESTLSQFFRALQTNDNSTLAAMSAAGLPGPVASWEVVEVESRSTEPFELPELRRQLEEATKERDAAREEREQYFADNQEALEQIIPKLQEDPEYKFGGRLGEIQEEWLRFIEVRREKERAFQAARRAADMETRLVRKSVMNPSGIEELEGDVAVTKMLLNLQPQDGEPHPFTVTLRKYDLSRPESGRIEPSRWIIADIEGQTPEAKLAFAPEETAPSPAAAEPTETATLQQAAATEEPSAEAGEQAAASAPPARRERAAPRQELRGPATVQILTPETKIEGGEVVSMIRARNVSNGWLTRFTVTEHWYDESGNAMRSTSRTHTGRFMPGEVIELELRTATNPNFYQNQFEFSHANGEVNTTVVGSLPETGEE